MKPGKKIFDFNITKSVYEQKSFDKTLTTLINKKNPDYFWEAYVEHHGWQKVNGVMDKFKAETGIDLLVTILPNADNTFDVFEFKKNGFAINNRNELNNDGDEWYYILPACTDNFHRDWKHDGICIQDMKKM